MANVPQIAKRPAPWVDQSPPAAACPKRPKAPSVAPSKSRQAHAPRSKAKEDPASRAVAKLVADPKADPAAVAAELRISDERQRIPTRRDPRERLPRRAFGVAQATERSRQSRVSFPICCGLPPTRTCTCRRSRALSRIADSTTIEQLAHEESGKELQRVLLAALLGRGDAESLRLYSEQRGQRVHGRNRVGRGRTDVQSADGPALRGAAQSVRTRAAWPPPACSAGSTAPRPPNG